MKRKAYVAKEKLLTDPVMAHMREVAFDRWGPEDVVERATRMRDDEGLLREAEQKRLRKQAKRKQL